MLIIVILSGIIFPLSGFELYLRSINYPTQKCNSINIPPENYIAKYDPKLGWRYILGITFQQKPQKNYPAYSVNINQEGFRTLHLFDMTDRSKPVIMFIGDSITFGHGIEFQDTFVYKIKTLFGDKIEVINMGVQGFGTDQAFLYLKEKIDVYKPIMVVYLYAWDQPNRNINYDRTQLLPCNKFVGTKPLFSLTNGTLYLKHKPKEVSKYHKIKILTLIDTILKKIPEKANSDYKYDLTSQLIKEMRDFVENKGIPLIILNYPADENEDVRQVLTEKKEYYLDLKPFYDENNSFYFVSKTDTHPSSLFHSLIADKFYTKFKYLIVP